MLEICAFEVAFKCIVHKYSLLNLLGHGIEIAPKACGNALRCLFCTMLEYAFLFLKQMWICAGRIHV